MANALSSGRIIHISPTQVLADGLIAAGFGDIVEIGGNGPALVTALQDNQVELAPLRSDSMAIGTMVHSPRPLKVPVGTELCGRVLDCLGNPLDTGPYFRHTIPHRVFVKHPCPILPENQPEKYHRLTTGLLVYDLKQVFLKGMALIASQDFPAVVSHLIWHQVENAMIVIYARIRGGHGSETVIKEAAGRRPLPQSVIIVESGPDSTPAANWLLPWSAVAIGSGLRAQGHQVLVVIDSLEVWSRYVAAFPWRGTLETQTGQLTDQAFATRQGSLTILALASPTLFPPVQEMFDGALDFSRALSGFPRHLNSRLCRPPIKVYDMGLLGRAIAALAEIEGLSELPDSKFPAGKAQYLEQHCAWGLRMQKCLQFDLTMTADSIEQLIILSLVSGFTEIPIELIPSFAKLLLARIRTECSYHLSQIRQHAFYSKEDHDVFAQIASEIQSNVKP